MISYNLLLPTDRDRLREMLLSKTKPEETIILEVESNNRAKAVRRINLLSADGVDALMVYNIIPWDEIPGIMLPFAKTKNWNIVEKHLQLRGWVSGSWPEIRVPSPIKELWSAAPEQHSPHSKACAATAAASTRNHGDSSPAWASLP